MTFNDVKYDIKTTKLVTIKNTGKTLAHWHFINKLEENRVSKRWIHVDIINGLLLPQETVNIKITVHLDRKTVQAINMGKESLDDVLILRIENFLDFYVTIKG